MKDRQASNRAGLSCCLQTPSHKGRVRGRCSRASATPKRKGMKCLQELNRAAGLGADQGCSPGRPRREAAKPWRSAGGACHKGKQQPDTARSRATQQREAGSRREPQSAKHGASKRCSRHRNRQQPAKQALARRRPRAQDGRSQESAKAKLENEQACGHPARTRRRTQPTASPRALTCCPRPKRGRATPQRPKTLTRAHRCGMQRRTMPPAPLPRSTICSCDLRGEEVGDPGGHKRRRTATRLPLLPGRCARTHCLSRERAPAECAWKRVGRVGMEIKHAMRRWEGCSRVPQLHPSGGGGSCRLEGRLAVGSGAHRVGGGVLAELRGRSSRGTGAHR